MNVFLFLSASHNVCRLLLLMSQRFLKRVAGIKFKTSTYKYYKKQHLKCCKSSHSELVFYFFETGLHNVLYLMKYKANKTLYLDEMTLKSNYPCVSNKSTLQQAASHHPVVDYFPITAQPHVVYSLHNIIIVLNCVTVKL